jgi:hypothetical protein
MSSTKDQYTGEERRQGNFEGTVIEMLKNIEDKQASMHLMLCGDDGMSGLVGRVGKLERFNEKIKAWGMVGITVAGGIGGGISISEGIKKLLTAFTGH